MLTQVVVLVDEPAGIGIVIPCAEVDQAGVIVVFLAGEDLAVDAAATLVGNVAPRVEDIAGLDAAAAVGEVDRAPQGVVVVVLDPGRGDAGGRRQQAQELVGVAVAGDEAVVRIVAFFEDAAAVAVVLDVAPLAVLVPDAQVDGVVVVLAEGIRSLCRLHQTVQAVVAEVRVGVGGVEVAVVLLDGVAVVVVVVTGDAAGDQVRDRGEPVEDAVAVALVDPGHAVGRGLLGCPVVPVVTVAGDGVGAAVADGVGQQAVQGVVAADRGAVRIGSAVAGGDEPPPLQFGLAGAVAVGVVAVGVAGDDTPAGTLGGDAGDAVGERMVAGIFRGAVVVADLLLAVVLAVAVTGAGGAGARGCGGFQAVALVEGVAGGAAGAGDAGAVAVVVVAVADGYPALGAAVQPVEAVVVVDGDVADRGAAGGGFGLFDPGDVVVAVIAVAGSVEGEVGGAVPRIAAGGATVQFVIGVGDYLTLGVGGPG